LPVESTEHKSFSEYAEKINSLGDNVFANMLLRLLSKEGQAYINTVDSVIKKPSNQDVVVLLFQTIKDYLESVRPNQTEYFEIEEVLADADKYVNTSATQFDDLKVILNTLPELKPLIRAIIILSMVDETLLRPVFSRSDAIGTLMRKKISHITTPLIQALSVLSK
jgi:hypothetical protein